MNRSYDICLKTIPLLVLACLFSQVACQKNEKTRADSKSSLGDGTTLCGLAFKEAREVELQTGAERPTVFVPEHVGSFMIDNLRSDQAKQCSFDLRGPQVNMETVFSRYGPANTSGVKVVQIGPNHVRVDYPIPGNSYGLISVEPRVAPPKNFNMFNEGGLTYRISRGAYLLQEDHQPVFRSLGSDTLIELHNSQAEPLRVSFVLLNTSDRLSEPVLEGLTDGTVKRRGALRLEIKGSLVGQSKASLTLKPRPLPANWSFVFGGDIKRELGVFMELLEQVRLKADPLFMLAAGDYTRNFLPHELQAYLERTAAVPFPVYTVKGNHELRAQGRSHYARTFGPGTYTFQVGGVLFVVLDATQYGPQGFVLGDKQFDWLEKLLADNRERPWKFLALHPPPHPLHGDTMRKDYPTNLAPDDAARLKNLAVKYGVAYVLSGHAHLYARGMEVGTVYLTSGGGGARLYKHGSVPGFTIRTLKHLMVFNVGSSGIEEQLVTLPRFEDSQP